MSNKTVQLDVYSDVLCIWAHISQIRLDEARHQFGEQLDVRHHFITLFGNTRVRIGEGWKDKGGFEGFAGHVHKVAAGFDHISLHPDIWLEIQPKSSAQAHLFLKAVQLSEPVMPVDDVITAVRKAFFEEAKDIGQRQVLMSIADSLKLDSNAINEAMDNGTAFAELCSDMAKKDELRLEGSPTFILNNGRQKLYGNVGYRILEANIHELLTQPEGHYASWC